MKIFKHLKADWFKYGFETLAVIVGILIAFALDNWNDNRLSQVLEKRLLSELNEEIQFNIDELESSLARQITNVTATRMILNLYGSWNEVRSTTEIANLVDSLTQTTMIPYTLNPSFGVIKSIVSTGAIAKIRNSEITNFISSFEDGMNDVTESEERLIINTDNHLRPRVYKYIRSMNIDLNLDDAKYEKWLLPSRFPSDLKGFFNDNILENLFVDTYLTQLNTVTEQERMLEHLEKMLTVVNSELTN